MRADWMRPFFILSAGRSGSTLMSKLFTSRRCVVFHEPSCFANLGPLNKLNYMTPDHRLSVDTLQKSRVPVMEKVMEACRAYGESSHSLATLAPALNEVFPDCRFIFLTRDGRDYVKSAVQWGVYTVWSKDYQNYCWIPRWDDPIYQEFDRFSVFQKNCWLWSAYNETILAGLRDIPEDRLFRLKLENLTTPKTRELFDWLGFDDFDRQYTDRLLATRVNASQPDPGIPEWTEWPEEMRRSFEKIAGITMEKLGYENGSFNDAVDAEELAALRA